MSPSARRPSLPLAAFALALAGLTGCSCSPPCSDPACSADAGDAGNGGDAGPVGPCGSVPASGTCLNASTIQVCSVPTDNVKPSVQTIPCAQATTCAMVSGSTGPTAQCVPSGVCLPGASQCSDTNTLQSCDNTGNWGATTCPNGCATVSTTAFCRPAIVTTQVTGTLSYNYHQPNGQLTDWDPTASNVAAGGFVVVSVLGDGEILDGTVTDQAGTYKVLISSSPGTDDKVAFLPVTLDSTGTGFALAVADPQVAAGVQDVMIAKPNPRIWSWSVASQGFAGGALTIQESNGSGAARVFDLINRAMAYDTAQVNQGQGISLIVWLGYNTSWTCGSCQLSLGGQTTAFGSSFQSQMWLNGDQTDQEYWADSVTTHETGHWAMGSFSFPPIEGGPHCLGIPDHPGMAWSEGWATWHSSDMRSNSVYVDKQGGTMFYFDLAARTYSNGAPWQRPTASAGLLQFLDENEVSAMLWSLSSAGTADAPLFKALAAPRMTTRMVQEYNGQATDLRGYTQHSWNVDAQCQPTGDQDLGIAIPMVADFLDALDCGGFSKSSLDTATNPSVDYPYPSASPLCQ